MITNIKNILEEVQTKSMKLKEGIVRGCWSDIVGKIYSNSQPLFIKDHVLYVLVENSIFLHNMTINKNKYLNKINKILKNYSIRDIKFKVSKVDKNIQITLNEMYINSNKIDEKKTQENSKIKINSEKDINRYIEKLKKLSLEREEFLLTHGFKKCKKCGIIYGTIGDFCIFCSKE
jgi:hypothetical protein